MISKDQMMLGLQTHELVDIIRSQSYIENKFK